MDNKCELCILSFRNDEQFKQHLEGKKHKKLESIKLDREKTASRSLFVSGLKKGTFLKSLEEHFEKFGKIGKIVIDQEKNAYAIIEYEEEASVENALASQTEHRVNEKSLKVSRRQVKEFVSRFNNGIDKKKELMDKLKEEALEANKLLRQCDSFDQQVIQLVEHLQLDDKHLELRKSICDDLNKLFSAYWGEDEFKVNIFGSTANGLACHGSDMDLTILFKNYFPENRLKQQRLPTIKPRKVKTVQVVNNGQDSSDSNLCELDEDIDYLDGSEEAEMPTADNQQLKQAISTFFNEKKYDLISTFDIEHQVKILAKIIQRLDGVKHLRTITNTRCPVVRFFHEKANIYCDLSLNNYLAYANTKLIQFYMELEPNLRRIIFTIRYWMKQKNLLASSKLNSYTVTWLIIFYLQQKHIGYLPTVEFLANMTNEKYIVHGWNCAFESDLEKLKSYKPVMVDGSVHSLNDLLKGFFDFYTTIHSSLQTSSPLTICTQNAKIAQQETELDKVTDFINIQDPFDWSHNLTANVTRGTWERFFLECKGSNEILEYAKAPRKSLTKCWGLILLMTKKVIPVLSPKISISGKELLEKSMLELKLFNEQQSTEMPSSEASIKKSIEFVLFLLKECLMFEQLSCEDMGAKKRKRFKVLNQICDQVDSLGLNCSPKRLKINNSSAEAGNAYICVVDEKLNNNHEDTDAAAAANIIATYQIKVPQNTWQGRRAVKRELKQKNSNLSNLELEKLISQKLIDLNQTKPGKEIAFNIMFYLEHSDETKENTSGLKIKFDLIDESEGQLELINFTTLVHFLDIYINNCHEKLFNVWNKNFANLIEN